MITAIDQRSVDQITSGQVVTSLASAAKELVENSLDAGATSIDIRLVNYGRDGFSVQDNGIGIPHKDFELLAKKHATSKLRTFSDLESVDTLGFRGEALASLCALANVTITTNDSSGGSRIEFDESGDIKHKQEVAAPRGTLVQVTNLFWTLPVRRKDFERNSQREFAKLVSIIQEYAIISPVRLTVEHSIKGRKNRTLASQGVDLKQRLACNFGATRLNSLKYMDIKLCDGVTLSGYISEPVFGKGEQSSEKQFLFINNRPTKHPRISRAITETYKVFNSVESPFFTLNLELARSAYDVNVSPDKRQILLHNEERLLQELREALKSFFETSGHNVPRAPATEEPPNKRARQTTIALEKYASKGEIFNQEIKGHNENAEDPSSPNEETVSPVDKLDEEGELSHSESGEEPVNSQPVQETPETSAGRRPQNRRRVENLHVPGPLGDTSEASSTSTSEIEAEVPTNSVNISDFSRSAINRDYSRERSRSEALGSGEQRGKHNTFEVSLEDLPENVRIAESHVIGRNTAPMIPTSSPSRSPIKVRQSPKKEKIRRTAWKNDVLDTHLLLPTTIDEISSQMTELSFRKNKIQNFDINGESAETRLSLTVRKSDFCNMRVVGQFNLGFILVVKPGKDDDLFVIDQHASDEIYNFERLQRETVLSRQPLVIPQPLELSAVEELTVQHHIGVFENNGFGILVDQSAPPGSQCLLSALPYSKNTVFDEKDVHELVYKVQEAPENSAVKCSKLRAMLAMRACRSSIMIGRPLSFGTMRRVVANLGTLDKPWNCPHGRPTLRHITTLS